MGTSNFKRPNASKYFVVLQDYEEKQQVCKDCGNVSYEDATICESCQSSNLVEHLVDVQPDEHDVIYLKDSIKEALSELKKSKYFEADIANTFAKLQRIKYFGDVEIEISFGIELHSGYYTAAILDYTCVLFMDGYEFDIEYIKYELNYRSEMGNGLKAIQSKNIAKWVENNKAEMIEEIETIFANHSEQYTRTATFSNGESIYQKIS